MSADDARIAWYREEAERWGVSAQLRIASLAESDVLIQWAARLAAHFGRLALGHHVEEALAKLDALHRRMDEVCERELSEHRSLSRAELVADAEAERARAFDERNAQLRARLTEVEKAIREHRDARGDDRCWMDDEALYAVLPEGYTPPVRDTTVELGRCEQFIKSRQHPATAYVSPQREIERLQSDLAEVEAERDQLKAVLLDRPVDAIRDAANLAESEARRWHGEPKTSEHWERVAQALRSRWLSIETLRDIINKSTTREPVVIPNG